MNRKTIKNCRNCGLTHDLNKCPAYGKTCFNCKKENHFAKMCSSMKTASKQKAIKIITEETQDENSDYFIGYAGNEIIQDFVIDEKKIPIKIDTGAACNVIGTEVYAQPVPLLSNSKMLILQLLIAVALTSPLFSLSANAHFESKLDNNLQPNVVPAARTKKWALKDFVKIVRAPPRTVTHEPGTRTVLECVVVGKPNPSVTWLENGEFISDYDVEANEILPESADTVGLLSSKQIITSSLSGDEYTCVATAGSKEDIATTIVYSINLPKEEEIMALENLSRLPGKPIITLFYRKLSAAIGADIILPCRAYSYTKAQVFWKDTKNNFVYSEDSDSRIRVLPSGDLLITDLRWTDTGNFMCTAKNIYGKDSVSTFIHPTEPKLRTD